MDILHLDLGKDLRGGQRQVLYLCAQLKEEGSFRPIIAAPGFAPLLREARAAGLDVLPLSGRREWDPRTIGTLWRFVRARRAPVIVHTHDAKSATLGALLKALCGSRVRLVHTRRVSYPLSGALSRLKYRLADAVVGVSAETVDVLAACGVDRERMRTIHSGIDPASYPKKQEAGATPLIGIIGALTSQKGHAVLLEALALLGRSRPHAAWAAEFVGEGPLRKELEQQAQSVGLAERVRFAGFQESRRVLPRMDILVVPSVDGEGSSGAIKEAWAVGVPLVASDLPSNLELARDEVNSLVVRRGDAVSLCAALARLLEDAELGARLVEQGSRSVQGFTHQVMAERYMEMYADLTNMQFG
ncbi:MAG: glycosyltransferase [Desulfocurvibacter africanus]